MENIHILGIDLAKRTFAACGTDKQGYVKFRQKLTRPQLQKLLEDLPPCIIANGSLRIRSSLGPHRSSRRS